MSAVSPDPELVRLCADRLKEVTALQGVDHLPQRTHVTKNVAETLEDPLLVMAGTNIDFKEVRDNFISVTRPRIIKQACEFPRHHSCR